MIYLGIVGSRKRHSAQDYDIIYNFVLDFINKHGKDITIVSGGAKGIDSLAEIVALELKLDTIIYKPDYSQYNQKGYRIYFERNKLIAKKSNYLLALPNSNMKGGTINTINYFKALGKGNKLTIK